MARANDQWKHFSSDHEVLAIFHGPHAYISPSWYINQAAVPTWNYAAVHVYGIARLEESVDSVRKIIDDAVAKYEVPRESPWTMPFSAEQISSMQQAIVGFSIQVMRVEAKYKLGQNKSAEDRQALLAGLSQSPFIGDQQLADFIRARSAAV